MPVDVRTLPLIICDIWRYKVIEFVCLVCTHVKSEHKKGKWGTHNWYKACALCYKDGWGGSRGIHPVHLFKGDNLKYLEMQTNVK